MILQERSQALHSPKTIRRSSSMAHLKMPLEVENVQKPILQSAVRKIPSLHRMDNFPRKCNKNGSAPVPESFPPSLSRFRTLPTPLSHTHESLPLPTSCRQMRKHTSMLNLTLTTPITPTGSITPPKVRTSQIPRSTSSHNLRQHCHRRESHPLPPPLSLRLVPKSVSCPTALIKTPGLSLRLKKSVTLSNKSSESPVLDNCRLAKEN